MVLKEREARMLAGYVTGRTGLQFKSLRGGGPGG